MTQNRLEPPTPTLTALLALHGAVLGLTSTAATLSERLDVQTTQARRTRRLTFLVFILVAAISWVGYLAVNGNSDNATRQCENANESRNANLQLWNFVLDISSAQAKPSDAADLTKIREWVGILYQPHDCDHLDRVYKIPPRPKLTG